MAKQSRFSAKKRPRVATQTTEKPAEEPASQSIFSSLQSATSSSAQTTGNANLGRQIDNIDVATAAHMQKVYTTVGSCTTLFGAGAAGALFTPLGMIHPLVPMIGGFVPLFMLYSSNPHTHSVQYRYGTMGAFTFMSGMGAAPLMGAVLATNPMNIPLAAGATTLIFGGFSAAALFSKQGSMLKMGGPLMGGTLGLGGLALVGVFYPMPILYTVWPYAFVTLGSLWVAYDTQSIITRFQEGDSDHIQHAMDLFIDLKMIFMSVLRILGMND